MKVFPIRKTAEIFQIEIFVMKIHTVDSVHPVGLALRFLVAPHSITRAQSLLVILVPLIPYGISAYRLTSLIRTGWLSRPDFGNSCVTYSANWNYTPLPESYVPSFLSFVHLLTSERLADLSTLLVR